MSATPTRPTASPAAWARPGSLRSSTAAMIAANTGRPALIIPATDDATARSAIGEEDEGDRHPHDRDEDDPRPVATRHPGAGGGGRGHDERPEPEAQQRDDPRSEVV